MKSFKNYIKEQHVGEDETTSDPEYLEKKEKKDRQTVQRITEPTKKISQEAKSMAKENE